MMHRVRFMAAAAVVSSVLFVAACDDDDDPSGPPAPVQTTFLATLNGANERPTAVTTAATGNATLRLFDDDSVQFTIQVASIDSVILSHIHAGGADTAGPILFGFPDETTPRSFTTLANLHTGTITSTSTGFRGSFTFDSLLTRLNAGTSYVNVHTRRNQGGEIRGQLNKQQ
ncbi:MAG: CHRD domain-containing protein [Gemmatimonadaceae bacterium]